MSNRQLRSGLFRALLRTEHLNAPNAGKVSFTHRFGDNRYDKI